jgi:hypothetical protein
MAQPTCESISMIFSMDEDSRSGDGTRFSTARTVPCGVVMPTVVEPSCGRGPGRGVRGVGDQGVVEMSDEARDGRKKGRDQRREGDGGE